MKIDLENIYLAGTKSFTATALEMRDEHSVVLLIGSHYFDFARSRLVICEEMDIVRLHSSARYFDFPSKYAFCISARILFSVIETGSLGPNFKLPCIVEVTEDGMVIPKVALD